MKSAPEPTPAQLSAARLTAWALDELPTPDAAAFTTETAADPALQSEAEAVRVFCGSLASELRRSAPPAPLQLSESVRQQLETAASSRPRRRAAIWLIPLSTAAGIAFLAGGYSIANQKSLALRKARQFQEIATAESARTVPSVPDVPVVPIVPIVPSPASPEVAAEDPSGHSSEVRRLFRMGLGYLDLGEFTNAEEQFKQVLVLDPTNTAARRSLEKTQQEVITYYRVARDHTRAKMLMDVDSLWVAQASGRQTISKEAPANWAENPDEFTDLNRPIYQTEAQVRLLMGKGLLEENRDAAGGLYLAPGTEAYDYVFRKGQEFKNAHGGLPENPFLSVKDQPLSTFSIDVDTASYAIARRHLNEGQRPPVESVRLEEMINYFPMDDAPPTDGKPFAVHVETASAPWAAGHRLVRVALKGKVPAAEARRPANLVFLVDTSGSMGQPNKLPLVQQSLRLLLDQLEPRDLVTLVTYAGDSELKLPATPVSERARIAAAIDSLTSGGSTNGSGGITTAYQQARAHLVDGGVNRVILATDGDFNVGLTSGEDLQTLIAREAKSGVYLSVLAYGSDNLKDTTAELLADQGNGNYAYIDSLSEARRALVTQLQGTLTTIAKDVKIQVEFNPAQVARYRLLGYENRALANKDFNDDTKDAGEIGAGHSVTALYEIVPAGAPDAPPTAPPVDPLKYQTPAPAPAVAPANLSAQAATGELLTVKLRYQQPEGTAPSQLIEVPVKDRGTAWPEASANFRWSAAVAGYGMLLRESTQAGDLTWETVRHLATGAKGPDPDGFRGEFLQLIEKAASHPKSE